MAAVLKLRAQKLGALFHSTLGYYGQYFEMHTLKEAHSELRLSTCHGWWQCVGV